MAKDMIQVKRERNAQKDNRPSATLSYTRVSVQKACFCIKCHQRQRFTDRNWYCDIQSQICFQLRKKLLESAAANAENNNGMEPANSREECYANQGPTMKRVRPRAQGHATDREENEPHRCCF